MVSVSVTVPEAPTSSRHRSGPGPVVRSLPPDGMDVQEGGVQLPPFPVDVDEGRS